MTDKESFEKLNLAKIELNIIEQVNKKLGNKTQDFLRGQLSIDSSESLQLLRKKYYEVNGSTKELINEFNSIIKFLSFRLGLPIGLTNDMEAEAQLQALNAIKIYRIPKGDTISAEHFRIFMNHQIRTGLFMFFLKNKFNLKIPRRILLANVHFNRAKRLLDKAEASDQIEEILAGRKSVDGLNLEESEKNKIAKCVQRIKAISEYPSGRPENIDNIIRNTRFADEIRLEELKDQGIDYGCKLEKYIAINQLLARMKKELGENAFRYWLLRQLGYRIKEMEAHEKNGEPIGRAGISYLIRRVERWIDKVGNDFVDGGVNDEDIRNYFYTKDSTG